jgi:hypothetical protein
VIRVKKINSIATLVLSATLALPAIAQEQSAKTKEDLSAVIALQGKPCSQVTDVQRLGENDYIAICQTGDRYRVNVGARGRVNVQRQ